MNLPNAIDVSDLENQLMQLTVDSKPEGSCIQDILFLETIKKNNNIIKTDDDGTLQVYCSRNPKTEFEYGVRGVVFNDKRMIYRGFPYTEEMNSDDPRIEKLDLKKFRMNKSFEGTLLKMFFLENRWYLTTHRKLNAFSSRWTSPVTFGDQFVDVLKRYGWETYDAFLDHLDKSLRYHFLLINNERTRIVIRPEKQKEALYLVLVTSDNDVPIFPLPPLGKVPHSEQLHFETQAELLDYIEKIDPFEFQGVLLYSDDFKKQFRVLNKKYQQYMEVRNNIACLKFCYAVCRHDETKRQLYCELYPDCVEIAKWYEERVNVIAEELFSIYKLRHIRKRYVIVSPERHGILQVIQQNYLETKKPIQLEDVKHVINTYPFPNRVYKIVNKTDKCNN